MIVQVQDLPEFKQKALQWASIFDAACYLDSNGFNDPYSKFDTLIAAGARAELTANTGNAFDKLERFRENNPGWMTGFLGYDLKNEIEALTSVNPDGLKFPDLYFFIPQHLVLIRENEVEINSDEPEMVMKAINQQVLTIPGQQPVISLKPRFSRQEYIDTVNKIKEHITRGDIYVTNFCQEFFAEDVILAPLDIFRSLNEVSPNPFSTFFKWNGNYILGASPERFLAKRGSKLISQPIKGTAKRLDDIKADEQAKQTLRNHPKELQENVMVVDLVRNDLTRSANPGTVKTEELFGIYSFKQVHQMISTVVCELQEGLSNVQAIKNTFPMGSMTGAPKVSCMQLMEQYERSKRGVYSGAIGYFSPDGDFDFNVVIRSLLYNSSDKYLSFHAGGAITYHAIAENEYEECLLKAAAVMEVLGGS
ncbi:anthranilate synthase component I family protein [Mucilaginibacter sp. SMC90]|uniref:anthranilate synthase component I family protein n=1 Tax=Mucilaginibacter sp. SMC90 TaxID=2929803 RepID=UPI001FB2C03F|nr:anthranilate synthase component I family protein [Mucilaginibacter sp. SMC90]UOE48068.1 anthranilate synthase component I family protein [Mucilaginibacter sp. SMC90]